MIYGEKVEYLISALYLFIGHKGKTFSKKKIPTPLLHPNNMRGIPVGEHMKNCHAPFT